MRTLALSILAIAAMALIALQHEQLSQLRAENANLQQASAEADRLKSDLAKSTSVEADAEDEIVRLREENRDLLKLRNQVYQLRQAAAQFEQVSAENLRLQSLAANAPKPPSRETLVQPIIIIQIQNLSYQGLGTPEAAVQTFLWAEREGNADALSNCIVPERWARIRNIYGTDFRQNLDNIQSIEIVARRDLDANTVQLGLQVVMRENRGRDRKTVITLKLRDGEWKLDVDGLRP